VQQSEVQVRRAHPDEWAAVRDVRLAALAEAPDAFASTLARERDRPEAEWRSRIALLPWFLAWHQGQSAGLVAAFPVTHPGRAGPAHPIAEWHLVSMWVPPSARGTGVAGLLVTPVLQHAREAGAERVTLWVATGNPRAAAFYCRMGFQPTGQRQVYHRADAADLDEEELAWHVAGAPATGPGHARPAANSQPQHRP
jgi:GNAT superfamily N-acetyltransferase